ncbi:MucR family transcriptional regulator [Sphingomonas piscis]|uniref:MucR family transcriptional regulator n=1 Tax=Sphingomonas piscis TaxID=2714943 RepID=A0A6G7YQS4_9SPHN|nr:MucR family transcriptional regulator [Sphingomonas piscis]QIK79086.1 MucR family transcriptional regulator [Sphingomonas piscis]
MQGTHQSEEALDTNTDLTELTADIVAAHVANNSVAIGDVGNLIQLVYSTLSSLGKDPGDALTPKTPLVPVRASVKPDFIVCMECGRKQKTLKRHLQTAHGMTPDQYRSDYGLPDTYPMTAPNYSEQRKALAKTHNLGRKPKNSVSAKEPKATRPRRRLSIKS